MNKRYRPLKLWIRLVIAFIIIILISSGIISIIEANTNETKDKTIVLSYNDLLTTDYRVYYDENDFYKEEFYGKNNQFVGNLINNMNFTFNYNFNISKLSDIEYEYFITGKLVGAYNSSNKNKETDNLLNNSYDFGNEKLVKEETSSITLSKEVELNYQEYNDVVELYRRQMNIPINSYMELTFKVNVKALNDEEKVEESSVSTFKIPLKEKAFTIEENTEKPTNKSIEEEKEDDSNKTGIYLGIIFIITGFGIFLSLFKQLFNIKPKNYFNSELERILKSYGEVVIEIVNGIKEENLNIVQVKGFNELLDLEEELRIPINFIETEPNYEAEFFIVHDKIMYKYILTDKED